MKAEELIDLYLGEKVVKGETLSGKAVGALKSKQHIFINGKHAVVVSTTSKGDNIELVYVKGRRAFGKEQYLDVKASDSKTVVSAGKSIEEGMTPGLKRAYGKMEGRYKCTECGVVVPKYEGRYPKKCASCGGEEFEDLQNNPRYSEAFDYDQDDINRKRRSDKARRAMDAIMRRVPQDRNPLGGLDYYEL